MRGPNPMAMKMRQEQIIRQHIQSLSVEDQSKFTQMNPHEKHEYLSQRNLLLNTNQMRAMQV